MPGQRGFWDVEDRLKELSAEGDPMEKLNATPAGQDHLSLNLH
jgi:transposase, IS5 family